MLVAERDASRRSTEEVELVWTGPEVPGGASRDTFVVVRELFATATRSVVISGYAIAQGKQVFAPLAQRMDEIPHLRVRMYLNVARPYQDGRSDSELVREFAERFRSEHWPGRRLPEVFFDPRSLSNNDGPRGCLHAKCIVIDDRWAFVTSANFTEAAQERNIEAGVLVDRTYFAQALSAQFQSLVDAGAIVRIHALT